MALILVVDDEARYRQMLTVFLKGDGHHVLTATDGREALEVFQAHPRIDLVLLDALMPILDGWETCRRLKALSPVPVIMLTALSDEDHEVKGLVNGADDYVGKPFAARVLLARVQSAVRKRKERARSAPRVLGSLVIDTGERRVTLDGEGIHLMPREFDLLAYLADTPGQVHSRQQLLDAVWGQDFEGDQRTVDTHIKALRHKLGPVAGLLVTFRGVGYALQRSGP